ncbi:unnamed protein product [Schistosoma mattheei]|uniref:C-type lectin domain-containing protein n=2 Tax=Schistosoma mattheei TaxID=31246 RepID=A0AA85ATM9_9TREM|nr:unnamed protein product [Schistosoma mattheei]
MCTLKKDRIFYAMKTFSRIRPLILLTVWNLLLTSSWKISVKHVSSYLTLVYVHDGNDARLSHFDAMRFCQKLSGNIQLINETLIQNATKHNISLNDYINTTLNTKHPNQSRNILYGDLVSIHSSSMIHVIMGWVLSTEARQFWIGGLIKLIVHEFNGQHRHVIQTWTDHTPVTLRFLHHHSPVLENLKANDIACLSIDYASGKWGVHYCTETKYFVCELLSIPNRRVIIGRPHLAVTPNTTITLHHNHTINRNNSTARVIIIHLHSHNHVIKHLRNTSSPTVTVTPHNTNSTTVGMTTTTPTTTVKLNGNTTHQTPGKK